MRTSTADAPVHPSPVYVYGVTHSSASIPSSPGVDGGELRSVVEDDIAALVSDAPSGDVASTRDRLLAHTRVLAEAARSQTVLPMRFGIVTPSEDGVRSEVLAPSREVFSGLLEQLDSRLEIDLLVTYEEEWARGEVLRRPVEARRRRRTVEHGPAEATGGGVRPGEQVVGMIRDLASLEARRLVPRLCAVADDLRLREPSHDLMVLNASFLVHRERVQDFLAKAEEVGTDGRLLTRIAGPMPPYSFADTEVRSTRPRCA